MKKFLYQIQVATLLATFGGALGYLTGSMIDGLPLVPCIVIIIGLFYILFKMTTFIGLFFNELWAYECYCDYMREQYPAKRILPESEFLRIAYMLQEEEDTDEA